MANETIFFSYSRDNTEFVLNLAKKLRLSGVNIWLDQLDIMPGTRWDSSIEQALKTSKTLLVILSKTSVASNNVMDEVSYALGENKKVVPLLLEECAIPFRLKRLQYADFTTDHQKGLRTLADALGLDQVVAEKLTEGTVENGSRSKTENASEAQVPSTKETPTPTTTKASEPENTKRRVTSSDNATPPQVEDGVRTSMDPFQPVSKSDARRRIPIFIGFVLVMLVGILWISGIFEPEVNTESIRDFEHIDFGGQEEQFKNDILVSGISNPLDDKGDDITESDKNSDQGALEKQTEPESNVVNGKNVSIVQYTDGQEDPAGYFRQVDGNKWVEESIIHEHETPFEEVMRDEWSVYLWDESRDMSIQLDLNTRQVILNYDKPDSGILYLISDFKDDL